VPYAATEYVRRLQGYGAAISMAAVGEPRENGYAERLMRTIKEKVRYPAFFAKVSKNPIRACPLLGVIG
jgi:transposase InsO family protein